MFHLPVNQQHLYDTCISLKTQPFVVKTYESIEDEDGNEIEQKDTTVKCWAMSFKDWVETQEDEETGELFTFPIKDKVKFYL